MKYNWEIRLRNLHNHHWIIPKCWMKTWQSMHTLIDIWMGATAQPSYIEFCIITESIITNIQCSSIMSSFKWYLRDTLWSCHVTHKDIFFNNLHIIVANVLGASKPILWYLDMSIIMLCPLPEGNSFKPCKLCVDLEKCLSF